MVNETLARMVLGWVKSGELNAAQGLRLYQQLQNAPERDAAGRLAKPSEAPDAAQTATGCTGSCAQDARAAEPIAVTGMSEVFPDAPNLGQFWENLVAGKDSVREIHLERWEDSGAYDPDPSRPDKTYCKWGGILSKIDQFDPLFFSISPKEAEVMDPQQRLFLMEAWKALEDAGYSDQELDGANCGVFVGYGGGDYEQKLRDSQVRPDAYTFQGNTGSILAARISYFLNLRGPSLAIDTACSSSLVAIHLACESLRHGACRVALAGGVMVGVTPKFHILTSRGLMLSKDGRCRTFDAGANGFVPGEGVAAIVLKPLKDALAERDHIYGVINGSGLNQDGKTNGITAPSATSQAALECEVYDRFGISPEDISYVEAHGTGTELGDPIEIQALNDAFRKYTRRRRYCAIGSVKTNIGHALTAAGVAGVIKVLLCLQHRRLVPSLHFHTPNPHIDFEDSPFYVQTEATAWLSAPGQPRQAVVSSFGFSGTNAHVAVREAPEIAARPGTGPALGGLVVLSAKSRTALAQKVRDLRDWLGGAGAGARLEDICYTLGKGRSHFRHRWALVVRDVSHLMEVLRALEGGTQTAGGVFSSDAAKVGQGVVGAVEPLPISSGAGLAEFPTALLEQAQRYARGETIDWDRWFEGSAGGRISMPTYPFELERYWIPEQPTAGSEVGSTKQLVAIPAAAAEPIVFQHTLQSGDWLGDHHRVEGEAVLPGVAFLEWVHGRLSQVRRGVASATHESVSQAAGWGERPREPVCGYPNSGEPLAGRTDGSSGASPHRTEGFMVSMPIKPADVTVLQEVVWMRPVVVRTAVVLELEFKPRGADHEVELRSRVGEEITVHARAIARSVSAQEPTLPSRLDLESIRTRCQRREAGGGDAFYARFRRMGLEYGGGFRALRELWVGADEVLGFLETVGEARNFDGEPALTPLLDAALHAIVGLDDGAGPLAMPFSLRGWRMIHPLPACAWSFVRRLGEGSYEVLLADEKGRVCVAFEGLTLRPVPTRGKGLHYLPRWERRPRAAKQTLESAGPGSPAARSLLCVCPAGGARIQGDALLAQWPGAASRLVLQLGEATRRLGPGEWEVKVGPTEAWDRALDGAGPFSTVLILAGDAPAAAGPEEQLRDAETIVLAALQVLKACVQRRSLGPRARIVFLTNRLFALAREDEVNPWSAALSGFGAGFRAEYPEWNVSVVDWAWPRADGLESGEARQSKAVGALVAEIEQGTAGLVGLRGGDRFERVLRPLEFQGSAGVRFKPNGVYLVVGGAGGLGFQFSLHLARKYRARLALLGRRDEDDGIRERLRDLEAAGGTACYERADVTDLASLKRAVAAVRARLGPIQGVVHSALVLEDALVRNLTPESMARVLGPKMAGTVNLDLALREEPLDFMVCFSSAQSFRANVGQSSYVSASCFQDAYAAFLSAHRSYPVFCVNWGYWGSVGIVSGDEFKKRLAAQGFGSIDPEEGVETVERFLNSPLRQIVCARATPELLAEMGWDPAESLVVGGREAGEAGMAWPEVQMPGVETLDIDGFQRDFVGLVDAGVERLWCWMAGRLWPEATSDRLTQDEIERRLEIRPTYRRLCGSLLEMLIRRGRMRQDEEGFRPVEGGEAYENGPPHPVPAQEPGPLTPTLSPAAGARGAVAVQGFNVPTLAWEYSLLHPMEAVGTSKTVRQPGRDHRPWATRFPGLGGYVTLLENCLNAFPDILRGARKPMEVMFPGGAVAGMTAIYRGNPLSNYCNRVVAEAVAAAVEHRLRGDVMRSVRILEIGAGVGGTSAFVLERIAGFGGRVAYDYTDIAGSFVRHGQEQFGERFPFVRFQVLDAEAAFPAQGVADETLDIIVGANVFHATRSVAALLKRLQAALRPGGLLVINEITALNDFATMTYGLTDGWWLFEEGEGRIPHSPLLTVASWQDRLWEAGFRGLHVWGAPSAAGLGLSQSVLAAQRGAAAVSARREPAEDSRQDRVGVDALGVPVGQSGPGTSVVASTPACDRWQKKSEPVQSSGNEAASQWVIETLSTVLKIKPERIDPETTFENYGVDSLVVLEINKQFEKSVGPLPATLLFEQKTVQDLARYFATKFPERFKARDEARVGAGVGEAGGRGGEGRGDAGEVRGVRGEDEDEGRGRGRGRELTQRVSGPGGEGVRDDVQRAGGVAAVEGVGDIAIVGLAGRYPQSETLAELWENLRSGRNCITEIPPERWDWRESFHPEPHTEGKSYSRWGGFIQDVDRFDPMFFNLSPREAERMDPQERIFLMTVWRLFEDAGYARRDLGGPGRSVGVFVGAMYASYGQLAARAWERGQWTGAFSALWSIANRVSYYFDLQGPSLTVDTACSSSLTAIHLACESLRRRECEWAVAGGVNLILDPAHLIGLSSMDMLSRGDRCSAFGAGADGFVDGEGVGAVLLKPLDQAVRDGDRIYGVIKGSMINAGGKTGGYTVPNPAAQTAVIREALRRARIEPETIGYVEAHGTGTALGDPIEVSSLAKALGSSSGPGWKCAIGSVKSNLGHLEAAAGMAGLTKVLLQLEHGALVPSLHSADLNPKIDFTGTPFVVQQRYEPWPPLERNVQGRTVRLPRRAGISSFGAGGANAHVIVEEYTPGAPTESPAPEEDGERLVVLSARTSERLVAVGRLLLEHLRALPAEEVASRGYLTRLAFTSQVAREPMLHRLALMASSLEDLTGKLAGWLEARNTPQAGVFEGEASGGSVVRPLVSGEAGRAFLAVIQQSRDWARLGQLWCHGIEIDWRALYGTSAPRKVPLPGYPFVLKRYWLPSQSPGAAGGLATRGYLDGELDLGSSLQEGLRFRFNLEAQQPWIRDHRVNGQAVLPGVVVMEMAVASLVRFQPQGQRPSLKLSWLEPLVFRAATAEVSIRWTQQGSQLVFEVDSEGGQGPVMHARGVAEFLPSQPERGRVDGAKLLERCPDSFSWSQVVDACRQAGIDYGAFYRSFEELRFNQEEAVAWLEIPEAFRSGARRFCLPPALLDGAVQLCGAHQLWLAGAANALSIPFSVEGLELLQALPLRVLAHVQRVGQDAYAVEWLDPTGTVCLRLRELSFRRIKAPAPAPVHHAGWRMTHARERLLAGPNAHAQTEAPDVATLLIVRPSERTRVRAWMESAVPGASILETVWGESTRALSNDLWELNPAQPEAFVERLRQAGSLRCLAWMGQTPGVPNALPLEKGAMGDVRRSFHLLKLLTGPSRAGALRHVTVVTEAAFEVQPGETVRPEGAGCHGLIQVLANEDPSVSFASIDLDPAEMSDDSVAGLPGAVFARWALDAREPGFAFRDGRRYRPMLEPALSLERRETGLRSRGVYWIVGGTGAIGLELGLYLAQRYQARLILSSRHGLNADQAAKLRAVEAAGGEVLHVQADAGEVESMRRVLGEGLARFGVVHGVFHSALVLKAARFCELTESDFEEVLRPKARGAAVLAEVLGQQALDFLAFFSSTQSFLGDAGQAAYAAASRWQDAVAIALRRQVGFSVHVIHWGYWDPQLIVTEEIRRRAAEFSSTGTSGVEAQLKALGYGVLSAAEGMAALERILAQRGWAEAAVFKAEPDVLTRMGGVPGLQKAALPQPESLVVPSVLPGSFPEADVAAQVALFDQAARALSVWGGWQILRALQKLGGFGSVEDRRPGDRWFRDLQIQPGHERLFGALVTLLVRQGLVEENGQAIGLAATAARDTVTEAAAWAEVEAARDLPGFRPFQELVQSCGQRYADLLAGRIAPNEVLFSEPTRVPAVYRGNPVADFCNQALVRGFESLVAPRSGGESSAEPLRILEVGAGTGGTTRALLPVLQSRPGCCQFTFTDLSSAFVLAARNELGPLVPGMEFKTLDLETDVVRQGFQEGCYDILIAANCLHATRSIRSTLRQAKRLLKRGGVLLLNEAAASQDFLTMTFGLLEGWWLFNDADLRIPHSPLLSLETWEAVLQEEGLGPPRLLGSVGLGGAEHAQVVLAAPSDGIVRIDGLPSDTVGSAASGASVLASRHSESSGQTEELIPDEPLETREQRFRFLERMVLKVLANVLRTEPQELEPGLPFADYGVDSILAVEIMARLNEALRLDLRSTDVFNYPNVAELATHILERHAGLIAWQKQKAEGRTQKAESCSSSSSSLVLDSGSSVLTRVRSSADASSEPNSLTPSLSPAAGERVPEAGEGETAPVHGFNAPSVASEHSPLEPNPLTPSLSPAAGARGAASSPGMASANQDIAVIGWSGQFPDAPDVRQLWENLRAGLDSVRDIPRERWDVERYYHPDPETPATTYCRTGGTLAEIDQFDAAFFNISPVEAERMDPQQRLLLMEAWKALEDAGYSERSLSGRSCAFFLGCQDGDYRDLVERRSVPNAYSLLGNLTATLAARISYYLNLKGPTVAVDTACSSSLTAIHLACDSIRSGQCDLALAGGVAVLTTPKFHVLASQAGMLSKTGQCRAFDQSADGFAPGEAVAVVVLKPLAQALRDRDRIYGVIKGSGLNQDGKSNGLTAPNGPSQTALEAGVYRRYGIDPRTIQYVECHGTGTRLGDPIEINALTDAFAAFTADRQFCGVGSIKTNIGHALAAAGVAGFIKALLCLREAKLVPSVHFKQANPALRIGSSPFYVVDQLKPWPAPATGVRRAAVSAFGLSGTNCHMVLEEAPPRPVESPAAPTCGGWFLIPVSAKTESSLARKLTDLHSWLDENPQEPIENISYSLLCRRSHFSYRVCWLVKDREGLEQALAPGLASGLRLEKAVSHLGENLKAPPAAREEAGLTLLHRLAGAAGPARGLEAEDARQLAQFYVEGCALPWEKLFPSARLTTVSLPAYPFERRRFWIEEDEAAGDRGPLALEPARSSREMVLLQKTWKPSPLVSSALHAAFNPQRLIILAGTGSLAAAASLAERFPGSKVLRLGEAPAGRPGTEPTLALDPWDPSKANPVIEQVLQEMPSPQGFIDLSDLSNEAAGSNAHVEMGMAPHPASGHPPHEPFPLTPSLSPAAGARGAFAVQGFNVPTLASEDSSHEPVALTPSHSPAAGERVPEAGEGAGIFKNEDSRAALSEFKVPMGKILLLQALIRAGADEPLAILHVTQQLHSVAGSVPGHLRGALTAGLVKMLGAEYQRVQAVTIDLDESAGDPARLAAVLLAEWQGAKGNSEVAYRDGVRYAPALVSLPATNPGQALAALQARLDPRKFYVVTGGTRGIGFEIARHLVDGGVRRLVLMGKQPIPPRERWAEVLKRADGSVTDQVRQKIVRFQELESRGVDLRIYSGSLTDEESLRQFLGSLEDAWGPLGGVVHCAGLASDEHPSFIRKEPETFRRVAEPKVEALAVLDRLLAARPLDFFVLFSSISSLAPRLGVGFSDYAMVNDFLNYYAAQRSHARPGIFQSLQWPGWKEVGMGQVKSPVYASLGLTAHTTVEGLALFDLALAQSTCSCLMPGVVDGDAFRPAALLELPPRRGEARPSELPPVLIARDAGGGKTSASSSTPRRVGENLGDTIFKLRALFAAELKMPVEKLGLETHFERLGVDSILLAEFTKRIERWLGVRLDPSCFLEHTNLRALADFLENTYPDQLRNAGRKETVDAPAPADVAAQPEGRPSIPSPAPATISTSEEREPAWAAKVAVIGMACHFPDAPDLGAYWQGLAAGRSSIREVPSSRWDIGRLYRPTFEPGRSISKWGAFLEGIEDFDPDYFRIPARVAPHLDPAIRQFLEVSVQCLRDSGYADGAWDGRRVGVFVGARMSRYSARIRQPIKESVMGMAQNFIGTHVSHFFNFTGPNVLIDTACSSSLVSIHQACQSLRLGDAEIALAGGVDILLDETVYLRLSEGQALSPDGRCHTFDEKANGFVPGEGCGVVLLKPLAQAIRDGDRIYAVIEGSAVNNDGRTMGMTTPNPEAQQAVVREALQRSGVSADAVGYVEAHGTGTMIGDPIELRALNRVFRETTAERRFCGVGSVKTNLGHLLSAAGVASFIKVALALQHRQLPPTLNCEKPNGRFNFEESPFYPVTRLQDWAPRHGVRRAGISSFGFGGTNAHLIMRELTATESARIPAPRPPLPPVEFRRRRYWLEPLPTEDDTSAAANRPGPAPGGQPAGNGNGAADHPAARVGGRRPLLEIDLVDGTEAKP